jgi:oligoribonuclease NrnB/cAMP/cGMP phosphodiesterase (DHH superfamily)
MKKEVMFFHNDLDGVMSALFLSMALNKEMIYIPAKHGSNFQKIVERYSENNYNIYIVDFTPNKLATFNADHHSSNADFFKTPDSKKSIFDSSAPSCAGLIAKKFAITNYDEIINIVDKVDSFSYDTPEDAAKVRYDFVFSKLILKSNNIDYCMKKALKILKTTNNEDFFKRASELIFGKMEIQKEINYITSVNAKTNKVLEDTTYENFVFLRSTSHEELNRNLAYLKGYDGVLSEYMVNDKFHYALVLNKFKGDKFANADASKICQQYTGGGGHKMAAGFSTAEALTVDDFQRIVNQVLRQIA